MFGQHKDGTIVAVVVPSARRANRNPTGSGHRSTGSWQKIGPGLSVVLVCVVLAFGLSSFVDVSPLVAGVVLGVVMANTGAIRPGFRPGFTFAAKRLLRIGIVLLGLRLSMEQVRELGMVGAVAVVVVVVLTFAGIQLFARVLGLSPGLGLLTATGFSICGASAVAAMEPLSTADEEETAYAIGLVTLCGTLSIAVLPLIGQLLDMSFQQFGTFAGAGVHDVGQVTATASAFGEESLPSATLVKLTRVILLAPMVAGVGLWARRRPQVDTSVARPPIVPFFVVAFLAAIALRATGWLSTDALSGARRAEQACLTAGMFGLGAGVEFARLRRLGGRPLVLGLGSWIIVAGLALAASYAVL
jgi:uncharacterized integral membrane protein (TIGR00698 family)